MTSVKNRFPSVNKKVFSYSIRTKGEILQMCSSPIKGPFDPRDRHRFVHGVDENEAVRRDRKKEEEETSKPDLSTLAFLLQMIKRTVDFFLSKATGSKPILFTTKKHLQKLKASFQILQMEDRSQDTQFLLSLSSSWQELLEDLLQLNKDSGYDKLKAFMNSIQTYPEASPHTFGYYLSEAAVQTWIPFPFMELVQKIHKEHELDPKTSSLTRWISSIDEIIVYLQAS